MPAAHLRKNLKLCSSLRRSQKLGAAGCAAESIFVITFCPSFFVRGLLRPTPPRRSLHCSLLRVHFRCSAPCLCPLQGCHRLKAPALPSAVCCLNFLPKEISWYIYIYMHIRMFMCIYIYIYIYTCYSCTCEAKASISKDLANAMKNPGNARVLALCGSALLYPL